MMIRVSFRRMECFDFTIMASRSPDRFTDDGGDLQELAGQVGAFGFRGGQIHDDHRFVTAHAQPDGNTRFEVSLDHGDRLDVPRAADTDHFPDVDPSHLRDVEDVGLHVLEIARDVLDIVESNRHAPDLQSFGTYGLDQLILGLCRGPERRLVENRHHDLVVLRQRSGRTSRSC